MQEGSQAHTLATYDRCFLHSPITRLPYEVLAHVFVEALPSIHTAADVKRPSNRRVPVSASHICREWRAIALATPQLWTHIYLNVDKCKTGEQLRSRAIALNIYLERSSRCPLFIKLSYRIPTYNMVPYKERITTISSVIRSIVDAQFRWRMVKINFPFRTWLLGYQGMDRIIDKCPIVEDMIFHLNGSSEEGMKSLPFKINIFEFSQLRSLRFGDWSCVLVDSTFTTFAKLTKFHLGSTSYHSIDTIFAIFAGAPFLEEVYLQQPYSEFTNLEGAIIRLPCLKVFHLGGEVELTGIRPIGRARAGKLENILARLALPALQDLEVKSDFDSNFGESIVAICDMVRRSSCQIVKFRLGCRFVSGPSIIRCLDIMPFVEELDLEFWLFDLDVLCAYLTAQPGIYRVCTSLQSLTLRYDDPAEYTGCITEMLATRSPPGAELYPDEGGPMLDEIGKARYGTSVLRRFSMIYGSSIRDDHIPRFVVDGDLAELVNRGLKVVAKDRWVDLPVRRLISDMSEAEDVGKD